MTLLRDDTRVEEEEAAGEAEVRIGKTRVAVLSECWFVE